MYVVINTVIYYSEIVSSFPVIDPYVWNGGLYQI